MGAAFFDILKPIHRQGHGGQGRGARGRQRDVGFDRGRSCPVIPADRQGPTTPSQTQSNPVKPGQGPRAGKQKLWSFGWAGVRAVFLGFGFVSAQTSRRVGTPSPKADDRHHSPKPKNPRSERPHFLFTSSSGRQGGGSASGCAT
jgi:hypothetical protein